MNQNELETITARQLRQILFFANDNMTVKELRQLLYTVKNQDKEYQIGHGLIEKMQADNTEN